MPDSVRVDVAQSDVSSPVRQHYRTHLDGLRTVAVYLVVAYHAGLGLLSGGFIGVDIFFVLSGFLVTGILLRDLGSSGRIQLQQFYSRRGRRILPASIVVLVVTAVVYSVVATPAESAGAAGGFRAAFVYIANWHFIREATDYFAVNVNRNPVLHFWSLAVEEQFYLLWPMVLAGLFVLTRRIGRWRWWVLRSCVAAAVVASAVAALHIATTNLDRAYYGTDTRAYQLLAGAALAVTPQLLRARSGSRWARAAPGLAMAAFLGILVLGTSIVDVGPITRGVLVAGLVVVLLSTLQNARTGLVKQFLSSGPMAYLGRISYGVYLWHWPVIVIASHGRSLSPVELFLIATPTATALAALSFHVLEHPIRVAPRLDRFKVPTIALGFAASVMCGLLLMPAILNAPNGSVSALPGVSSTSKLTLLDWRQAEHDFPRPPDCLGKPADQCTILNGSGRRVVLMGDSNAMMWIPTFTALARKLNWNFSATVYYACPWQDNLLIPPNKYLPSCALHQSDWYTRVVPALNPDLVVLVTQALDNPNYPLHFLVNGRNVSAQQPELDQALSAISVESLHALARPGREFAILEPVPQPPFGADPLDCISAGHQPRKCGFPANPTPTPLELFYRAEGRQPGIHTIDLDHVVCPRWPRCDSLVGNIIARKDGDHLTSTYAASLASNIEQLIPRE
jgi:peptidoglycan/LPS O-acetylase OafA/YrhL